MSRFDALDVTDSNVRLFNHLTKEYVLRRLLSVYPKASFGGRRPITVATRAAHSPIKTIDTNLILIPTVIQDASKFLPVQEYLPIEELEYINDILREISIKEADEQAKEIRQIVHSTATAYPQDQQERTNSSSSSSSSIPQIRSRIIENMPLSNNDLVNQWLDNGQ